MTGAEFEAYDGPDPYCFISYSHANTSEVFSVLNVLSESNFRIWYDDTMEIGDDFRKELHERIAECDAFLIFMSDQSMNSKYCGMEVITAHQLGKRIFPIQLREDTEIPAVLRLILENLQHVKAHSGERRYINKLIQSLPPETMRRLLIQNDVLIKCSDNGRDIAIPEGVRSVGPAAFMECVGLERIEFPESLERIEDGAFRGCSSLTEVHLGAKIDYVGHSAFRDCIRLQQITAINPLTFFEARAFENCASVTEVSFPNECEEIFEACFNSCISLTQFNFPSSIKMIRESAFADCSSLDNVELPDGVVKVDANAFEDCVSLKSIVLPSQLSKIGRFAFKGCTSLEEIDIPEGVTSISGDAFRECLSLKSINVSPANMLYKSVGGVMFNKNRSELLAYPPSRPDTSYEVPDSVSVIDDWAFCQADSLESIAIPDSVREIGEGAFYSAEKLRGLVLPPSLDLIDDSAFRGCSKLSSIVIPERVRHIGWGAFSGCPNLIVQCSEGSYAWRYCETNNIPHKDD